jgi:hypothetical protein
VKAGRSSEDGGEFGERCGDAESAWGVGAEFVVAAAQVLHKGVSGNDRLRGAVGAEPARRSEPVLELAGVGFHPVVGLAFDVVPRRGTRSSRTAGYIGAASATTSVGRTFNMAIARRKNRPGLPLTTLSGIAALRTPRRPGAGRRRRRPPQRPAATHRARPDRLPAALSGLHDLLTRLDAATAGGSAGVRPALQVLDDGLRTARGVNGRPCRLPPAPQRPSAEHDGPPLTPAQQDEVRRYMPWLRHRDG